MEILEKTNNQSAALLKKHNMTFSGVFGISSGGPLDPNDIQGQRLQDGTSQRFSVEVGDKTGKLIL